MKRTVFFLAALSLFGIVQTGSLVAENANRPFSIADDIGLSIFVGEGLRPDALFSPDGNYVGVYVKRGRLDTNRPENSLRFYRTDDIENAFEHPVSPPPAPAWILTLSTDSEGPIIANWHWLADSSGVAFLQRVAGGNYQLTLADIQK